MDDVAFFHALKVGLFLRSDKVLDGMIQFYMHKTSMVFCQRLLPAHAGPFCLTCAMRNMVSLNVLAIGRQKQILVFPNVT